MRDFKKWIAKTAPNWTAELAGDLANCFEELDELIANYILRKHSPSEFSAETDRVEAKLQATWDDQVEPEVIAEMLEEFYKCRKDGEAEELIAQLRAMANEPQQQSVEPSEVSHQEAC